MFTPPSVWWPKWELVAVPTTTSTLRPGMPCSWLLSPAALAQCAWLAGAGIKAARAWEAAGWHVGTSTSVTGSGVSQLQPTARWSSLSQPACIPLQAAPLSDIHSCCLPVLFSAALGCYLLYELKKKKNQLHRWLIVAQLYSSDSDVQFVFILQLNLVFSSHRSWIQIYIFSLPELASCQENKHLLLSATL